MKIAVWIDYNHSPKIGGTFSYVDRLIKAIDRYEFGDKLEICFATTHFVEVVGLHKELVRLRTPFELLLSKIPFLCNNTFLQKVARRLLSSSYVKQLERNGVKMVFYPSQFVIRVKDFPFIASHWDIAHRSTYAFPELSIKLHKYRDYYYKDILPKALMIFAESEAGKLELMKYTNLNEERIRVVPIFPGDCSAIKVSEANQDKILKELGLEKEKYFYYPAQFLPEKNHYNLLLAFSQFVKNHSSYKLVFTGSSPQNLFGTIEYIKEQAKVLGVEEQVLFAGFVSVETIYCLYKNSCAHIMASYVGPTNMPPLEAMFIGCPVICSDLSGHREEMGDAALYFDAKSPNQIVEKMEEVINNRDLYMQKIKEQSYISTFTLENALSCINNGFMEASVLRSAWA